MLKENQYLILSYLIVLYSYIFLILKHDSCDVSEENEEVNTLIS